MTITSSSNPRVKAAARLRDRRGRDTQGRIIIDGAREIDRALVAGVQIVELFYCDQLCTGAVQQTLLRRAKDAGAEMIGVTPQVLEKLSYGNRVEGLVAVALPPHRALSGIPLGDEPLLAVVEGAEKPGNLGAILRTADGAGVAGLIVADGETDLFNPNAIRASLGAIFTMPVCQATSEEALAWLEDRRFRILAARVDAAVPYTQADFHGRVAIVLGSEARGLTDQWRGPDIRPIKVPMLGQVDSLNLSATAAVLFYEALRQRRSDHT